jgi:ADP-ribose pyrophosphatase YjhB (NUDIX family)
VKTVVRHEGRWLMIRNSYGRGLWTFPGGGVRGGERPADAAMREVREEVGIELGGVEPVGIYTTDREYKHDTVYCFVADVMHPDHRIDNKEVIEAAWFDANVLPERCGASVAEVRRLLAQP